MKLWEAEIIHANVGWWRGSRHIKFRATRRCIGYDRDHGTHVLEDYVKSVNASDYVECIGPLYGKEKNLALAECDLFCLPSRYESFSYALTEGLGSDLPVLVGFGVCLTSYFDDDQLRTMVVPPESLKMGNRHLRGPCGPASKSLVRGANLAGTSQDLLALGGR